MRWILFVSIATGLYIWTADIVLSIGISVLIKKGIIDVLFTAVDMIKNPDK